MHLGFRITMNSSKLLKIRTLLTTKNGFQKTNVNSFFTQRFCCSILKKRKNYTFRSTSFTGNNILKNSAFLSGCSFKNCEDKVHEKDENAQNALDNEEFQNILKDFAKDFEVGDESQTILEDIRKNLNETGDKFSCTEENDMSSKMLHSYHSVSKEKYTDFKESDSSLIFSHEDLQSTEHEDNQILYHVTQEYDYDLTEPKLQRGVHGVFDIDELVDVLRQERVSDIAVISIPRELHYADFLVLVTSKSPRHSKAVTELINKLYKKKKNVKDPFIIIEGEKVSEWKAMDMGNIVLHVFLQETRALYDIESLWLFDSNYDSGGNVQVDPMISAIEEQMAFFASLQHTETSPNKDVKAGGMRITQHKVPSHEKPVEVKKTEGEEEEEEVVTPSPPKQQLVISGALARGDADFPTEAVQAFHNKPIPSHDYRSSGGKPNIIHQPRK